MRSVSESDLAAALELSTDRNGLSKMLLEFDEKGKGVELLRRLSMQAAELTTLQIETVICSFLDVSDRSSRWGHSDRNPSPIRMISLYLADLVNAISEVDERMDVIKRSLETGKGICGVVKFADSVLDMAFHGKPVVDEANKVLVSRAACKRIEAAAEKGELLNSPCSASVIYRWMEWDRKSAGGYIVGLIKTDAGLFQLLQSFQRCGGTYSDSSGYIEPSHADLAKIIGNLIPRDNLEEAAARAQEITECGSIDENGVERNLKGAENDLLKGFAEAVRNLDTNEADGGET
jgi:hypothetical protein